jgi:hypothetical protein
MIDQWVKINENLQLGRELDLAETISTRGQVRRG